MVREDSVAMDSYLELTSLNGTSLSVLPPARLRLPLSPSSQILHFHVYLSSLLLVAGVCNPTWFEIR